MVVLKQTLRARRYRWVHFIPIFHLFICLIAMSGYVIPALQPLGILFTLLNIADFPISLVGGMLGWQHGTLGAIWLLCAGTLWWYILCRTAELIHRGIRRI